MNLLPPATPLLALMFPALRDPETMTAAEQAAMLRGIKGSYLERVLYAMALGTDLRLGELVGINVCHVPP